MIAQICTHDNFHDHDDDYDRVSEKDHLMCAQAICDERAYEYWFSLGASRDVLIEAHKAAYRRKAFITIFDFMQAERILRKKKYSIENKVKKNLVLF